MSDRAEAARWKALRAWAWMPGMECDRRLAGHRIDGDGMRQWGPYRSEPDTDDLPNLDDPGTRGCLLDLSRTIAGGTFWIAARLFPGERIAWEVHGLSRGDGERVNAAAPGGFDTETAGMLAVCEYMERLTYTRDLP